MKFCECGCGLPAPIAKATNPRYGHVKGQPVRFIQGHHNRRRSAETLAKLKVAAEVQFADPAARARMKATLANPAVQARKLAAAINRWKDPAARARQSENHKRLGLRVPPGHEYRGYKPTKHEALLLAELPSALLHHRIIRDTGRSFGRWAEVDLALPAARVAVEIDGKSHRKTTQKAIDRRKENFLMSRGWRVIRIPNENVLDDIDGVVAFILAIAARPAAAQTVRPF